MSHGIFRRYKGNVCNGGNAMIYKCKNCGAELASTEKPDECCNCVDTRMVIVASVELSPDPNTYCDPELVEK